MSLLNKEKSDSYEPFLTEQISETQLKISINPEVKKTSWEDLKKYMKSQCDCIGLVMQGYRILEVVSCEKCKDDYVIKLEKNIGKDIRKMK